MLRGLGDAIAANNVRGVLDAFSDSDGVVMFGSEGPETAYGRAELERVWTRVLSRGQRYVWHWSDETVASIGGVAWLSAKATVSIDDQSGHREVPYRATMVLTQSSGQWLIEQYHGSEPGDVW